METIINFLEENDSVLDLNLMNNNITENGIIQLSQARNLKLKSLRVNGNKIGPKGLKSLVMMLSSNSTLTHLDVGETDMDISALAYFTTVLRTNNTVQAVNFNRILGPLGHTLQTDHVADLLQQMLVINNTLRELHLQKIGFVDHDIELLVEGLKHNSSILLLDLSCNNFGDHGVERLAEYIGRSPLQTLMVSSNNIRDSGARSLSMKFPYSRITFMDISKNHITEEGVLDILNCLKKEHPIQGLFIRGNQIGEKACKVLYRMLLSGVLSNDTLDVNLHCERGSYHYSSSHAADHVKPHYYCLCSSTYQRMCSNCDVTVVRGKKPVDKL
ncbi:leucine-rich repeat-containing protein 34-like isoform X2 [Macrosteles quadrilineatus]|nr:leucine-rich repeat-containing protein 34-like isoform X2 [Macrosteles quadrilineatus]